MSIRRVIRLFLWLCTTFLVAGIACYWHVERSASPFVTYNRYALPHCRTGLILGTAKWLKGGNENPYFSNRISAAIQLYRSGRITRLILSGDNRSIDYNEPMMMQKSLHKAGLPDSVLVADYAGLRTFDSMVRADEIFGQDSMIVISQRFHTLRAVFIARSRGLVAFGYNADDVHNAGRLRIAVREFFSRIRCVLDVYVLNSRPRHLGEKININ